MKTASMTLLAALLLATGARAQGTSTQAAPTTPAAPEQIDAASGDQGVTSSAEVTESAATITAEKAPEPAAESLRFPLTVGLGVGVGFSQLMSELGTSVEAALDVGYLLPFIEQRLAVAGWMGYRRPKHSVTLEDPRLAAPSKTTLTEQELLLGLGGVGRLFPPGTQLNFHARLGLQLHLQRSGEAAAAAGASFGANREQRTALGLLLGGGAEWMLGPGALTGELRLDFANLDHRMTGDATAGGLGLIVGYRMIL